MMRGLALTLLLAFVGSAAGVPCRGIAEARGQSAVQVQQDRLEQDLRDMEARLGTGRLDGTQVVSDSQRLRQRFVALHPFAPRFGPDDYRRHGRLAGRSFAWLSAVSGRFRGDRHVVPALVSAYSVIGDFYGASGLTSRSGFWFGYAGAHRAARSLATAGQGDRDLDRTLESLALSWALVAAMDPRSRWAWSGWDGARPGFEQTIDQAVGHAPVPPPVALPSLDEAALSPDDRPRWHEVRNRFASTSSRAHEAQLALADLRGRLAARGLSLHPTSVAASLSMQGYLDDAVEAIEAHRFAHALQALTRADYERAKLRDATGQ
ncbi:MAG: hypothetical protein IT179_18480 [Acidobacteria bacterium]|nr:hypothetical protein [Acidobacteriota bacterium]